MKSLAAKKPVLFGIIGTIIILVLDIVSNGVLFDLFSSSITKSQGFLVNGATKVVLFVPTAILLGYIIKSNGFKFAFSTKGFAKGMFASIPIFLCIAVYIVASFFITEINRDALSAFPAIVVQQTAISFYEEVLVRGLLITAILIKLGDRVKGRIIAMLVSVILFVLFHMANIFVGSSVSEAISNSIMTIGPGIMLAAVYIYSKNILSAMIMHTLYNLALHVMSLASQVNDAVWSILNIFSLISLFIIGPILAIILIIKAKPFGNVVDEVNISRTNLFIGTN